MAWRLLLAFYLLDLHELGETMPTEDARPPTSDLDNATNPWTTRGWNEQEIEEARARTWSYDTWTPTAMPWTSPSAWDDPQAESSASLPPAPSTWSGQSIWDDPALDPPVTSETPTLVGTASCSSGTLSDLSKYLRDQGDFVEYIVSGLPVLYLDVFSVYDSWPIERYALDSRKKKLRVGKMQDTVKRLIHKATGWKHYKMHVLFGEKHGKNKADLRMAETPRR
ncbi:unnamed protein product [Symbiodinium sp. CCMP2456]|nr:unnamed protein product [Symbiodinium sp. CCMP2456]